LATKSPSPTPSSKKSISGGAIGGIVVGVLIVVANVIAAIFIYLRRKRRKQQSKALVDAESVRSHTTRASPGLSMSQPSTQSPTAVDQSPHSGSQSYNQQYSHPFQPSSLENEYAAIQAQRMALQQEEFRLRGEMLNQQQIQAHMKGASQELDTQMPISEMG
jgi:hypothetical protein